MHGVLYLSGASLGQVRAPTQQPSWMDKGILGLGVNTHFYFPFEPLSTVSPGNFMEESNQRLDQ